MKFLEYLKFDESPSTWKVFYIILSIIKGRAPVLYLGLANGERTIYPESSFKISYQKSSILPYYINNVKLHVMFGKVAYKGSKEPMILFW